MSVIDEHQDEQLKIIVRDHEYVVSKKLICSSVPYFEKIFCCDSLRAKENKVELDFDERIFTAILNWLHSGLLTFQIDSVISFYNAADYLMIEHSLFEPCVNYFYNNFSIEHLPVVSKQVNERSKLINSQQLNNFICRHFLMIANTTIFLDYPVELVEAILKLDLMVYSEHQILEAIIKWVNKDVDSRKGSLEQLLDCVRWSFLDKKDHELVLNRLENKINLINNCFPQILNCIRWPFMKLDYSSEVNLIELSLLSIGEREFDRSKQNFFILIHQKDSMNLRINLFDNELCSFPIGDFTQDDSMSLEFFHGNHMSDILYDFGSEKGIRIDWSKKTFRWLELENPDKSYNDWLLHLFLKFLSEPRLSSYVECCWPTSPNLDSVSESLLLESDGQFILIGKNIDKKFFVVFPLNKKFWFLDDAIRRPRSDRSFQATVMDDIVYILTESFDFIQFNMRNCCCIKSRLNELEIRHFSDLFLTSHAKNDDKVILVDKRTGKVYTFYTNQKKWVENCRIMKVKFCSNSFGSYELVALTSTFIPIKVIKPLYERNVHSK